MVNSRDLVAFAALLTPGLASALVTGLAWLVSPGRRSGWWWAPGALVMLISLAIGLVAYLDHAPGLISSRALGGAALAAMLSAIPLSMYYAAGRLIRSVAVVVITWIASLVLLYPYAFFASLYVVALTQCGPGAMGCPFE